MSDGGLVWCGGRPVCGGRKEGGENIEEGRYKHSEDTIRLNFVGGS